MEIEKTSMGLQPLYSKWASIREQNKNGNDGYSEEGVKKFLFKFGFLEFTPEVLSLIVPLIISSARGEKITLDKAYNEQSKKEKITVEAVRTKLSYYIEKNFENVREAVIARWHRSIGDEFRGNKNFIMIIGTLYAIYTEECKDNVDSSD